MTVKCDMQQKHGSPPRVTRNSSSYFQKCNNPCAFYSPQHGGYKLFCGSITASMQSQNKWMQRSERLFMGGEKEMGRRCSEVKHEVMGTAALPKLKITYMHHGRVEMYVWDYKMQRDDEDS